MDDDTSRLYSIAYATACALAGAFLFALCLVCGLIVTPVLSRVRRGSR